MVDLQYFASITKSNYKQSLYFFTFKSMFFQQANNELCEFVFPSQTNQ